MRHIASIVAALTALISFVTACDDGGVGPVPGSLVPVVHPSASPMAFVDCELEWDVIDEVCGLGGLVIMTPDGREERFFGRSAGGDYDTDPAWSPDGRRIGFTGFRHCRQDEYSCSPEIYVMNVDGSGVVRLTHSPDGRSEQPAWAPDGRRIAYVASAGGRAEPRLRVMNADGSGNVELNGLKGESPAWSPDGTLLAFSAPREGSGSGWGIHVADPYGLGQRPITSEPGTMDRQPTWSPDGRRLAFTRSSTLPASSSCRIYVAAVNGSSVVGRTRDAFCASGPAWSPDGATIAFKGNGPGLTPGIFLMNADAPGLRMIRHAAVGSRVAWAPLPTR